MRDLKKGGFDPMMLTGVVFTAIGASLVLGGAMLCLALNNTHIRLIWMPVAIMCAIGIVFLALGIAFLAVIRRRQKLEEELKSQGDVVYADVTGVAMNCSVSVHGRHPWVVEASCRDPFTGKVHLLNGKELYFDPGAYAEGMKVPIYRSGDDFGKCFMDVDSMLPEVVIH